LIETLEHSSSTSPAKAFAEQTISKQSTSLLSITR